MADHWQAKFSGGFAILGLLLALGSLTFALITFADRTSQINKERARNTFNACAELNERHDDSIKALDTLLAKALKKDPKRKAQIETSRASTVFLINALVPKRDCKALVAKQVS